MPKDKKIHLKGLRSIPGFPMYLQAKNGEVYSTKSHNGRGEPTAPKKLKLKTGGIQCKLPMTVQMQDARGYPRLRSIRTLLALTWPNAKPIPHAKRVYPLKPACKAENCGVISTTKGLCSYHYKRKWYVRANNEGVEHAVQEQSTSCEIS